MKNRQITFHLNHYQKDITLRLLLNADQKMPKIIFCYNIIITNFSYFSDKLRGTLFFSFLENKIHFCFSGEKQICFHRTVLGYKVNSTILDIERTLEKILMPLRLLIGMKI